MLSVGKTLPFSTAYILEIMFYSFLEESIVLRNVEKTHFYT